MEGYRLDYTPTDLDEVTRTAYGEVRGEPIEGQIAFAWVVRTRATWDETLHPGHPEHEWWGTSITGVCEAHYQFSCRNPDDPNLPKLMAVPVTDFIYRHLNEVCRDVMDDKDPDPTNGATHYKVTGTKASWDKATVGIEPVIIGHHSFYRLGPHA